MRDKPFPFRFVGGAHQFVSATIIKPLPDKGKAFCTLADGNKICLDLIGVCKLLCPQRAEYLLFRKLPFEQRQIAYPHVGIGYRKKFFVTADKEGTRVAIKNPISEEQKSQWLDKFYRRMSTALYKWSILPPSVIVESRSINKYDYRQPITSAKINYKGISQEQVLSTLSE